MEHALKTAGGNVDQFFFHSNAPLQMGMRGAWWDGENLEGGKVERTRYRVECCAMDQ